MIPADGSVSSTKLANNIEVAGQLTVVSQPALSALSDNHVMTKGLFDAIRESLVDLRIYKPNIGLQRFTAGSGLAYTGGTATAPWMTASLITGTTAGSSSGASSGGNIAASNGATMVGDSVSTINFSRKITMLCRFSTTASAGCLARVSWGSRFNGVWTAAPTAKSIGFVVDGAAVKIYAHNGTTYVESASLLTLTANILYELTVISDGVGNLYLYNGDVLLGTLAGAPTGLSAPPSYGTASAVILNQATTTSATLTIVGTSILTGDF
jgi:hypothetical protein